MAHQSYRLRFGRHKGKSLEAAGSDYCAWLVRDRVYDGKPDLEAALISGNHVPEHTPRNDPSVSPTQHSPAEATTTSPSRPHTPFHQTRIGGEAPPTPPSSGRRSATTREASQSSTILQYGGSTYKLDFGKHAGKSLREVDGSYLNYLINEVTAGRMNRRPRLMAAMREEGFISSGGNGAYPYSPQPRFGNAHLNPWTSQPSASTVSLNSEVHFHGLSPVSSDSGHMAPKDVSHPGLTGKVDNTHGVPSVSRGNEHQALSRNVSNVGSTTPSMHQGAEEPSPKISLDSGPSRPWILQNPHHTRTTSGLANEIHHDDSSKVSLAAEHGHVGRRTEGPKYPVEVHESQLIDDETMDPRSVRSRKVPIGFARQKRRPMHSSFQKYSELTHT